MQEQSQLFDETFYPIQSSRTQAKEDDQCSPWQDELQNYRKQPIYKPRVKSNNPHRRYTSQVDAISASGRQKDDRYQQRDCILPYKSVTIQYETNKSLEIEHEIKQNKFKLPALPSKRGLGRNGRSNEKEANWGLLSENKRNSLKRYTPKLHFENVPYFEAYKKSLVAARRFVMNAISNPEVSLQYLNSL